MKTSPLIATVIALLTVARVSSAQTIDIGSRLEPLVDRYMIDRLDNVTHQLHQPVRRENVMIHDKPWEGNTTTYHVVLKDGDTFRMYYRGTQSLKGSKYENHVPTICVAESTDGINWTRPNVGLIEFDGSKDNNIVLTGVQAWAFAPFIDTNPDCKPEERYKAITVASRGSGLLVYASPDGLRWSPLFDEIVIPKIEPENSTEFDTLNTALWDSITEQYFIYFRRYRPLKERIPDMPRRVRDTLVATSKDLKNWSEQKWLSYPGAKDEELYTNGIIPYERAPHLRIGVLMRYVPSRAKWLIIDEKVPYMNGSTDALLMSSRDGYVFHRWAEAFIRPGLSKSAWATRSNLPAWGFIQTTSDTVEKVPELSFYATEGYYHGEASRLRRYTMRLDGFASVHADAKGGRMRTKFLTFEGSGLYLNYSSSVQGGIRVEIQDRSGKPIPGFTLEDCKVMYGDEYAAVVTWKNGSDVSALSKQPIRLVFELNDADLYAIQFK